MNSISKDIRDLIVADPNLSAVGDRVFNYRVEQSYSAIFPAIVFDIDLPLPSNVLEEETSYADLWNTRFSIFTISDNPDQALELSGHVLDLFHHFTGELGSYSIKNILVQGHSKFYELEPEMFLSQLDFFMYSADKPQFITS